MKLKWLIVEILICVMIASFGCKKESRCLTCPSPPTDSTSHDFTWQTFTFGNAGGSQLYDVAIINDTLAYAVGAIYLNDSTTGQPDPQPYNLAVWNGKKWDFRKVTVNFRGNMIIPPLEGIFAFSPVQIWLIGSLPIYGDGTNWTVYDLRTTLDPNISISIGWGNNPNSMYFVGRGGNIVFYSGSSWTKLSSGTTLPINDIWGGYDIYTGQLEILAVASDDLNKKVLRIQGTTVSTVPDDSLSNSLYGVWFVPGEKYYIVGAGIGSKSALDSSPWSVYPSGVVTSYMSGGVRGNDINDVFVTGSFFEIVHYNGSTWHNYRDVIPFADGGVGRIAIKGNLMITVGLSGQQAVAIVGKR